MSGLDFQVVDVKFTEGLDTRTQRKLVVPGKWDQLVNLTLSDEGTPKKRDGVNPLVQTLNGNGLASHGDELISISAGVVQTVGSAGGVSRQMPGEVPYLDVAKTEVDFTNGYHDGADCAVGDGYACYVWRDLSPSMGINGVRVTVIDTASGAKLLNASAITNSPVLAGPRVVFFGNAFYIFHIDTVVGTDIFCNVIATSAPSTVGTKTSLVTDPNLSTKNFDACLFEGGNSVVVAFMTAAPSVNSVRAIGVTRTGTTPSILLGPTALVSAANATEASIWALTCRSFGAAGTSCGFFLVKVAGGALGGGLVGVVTNATLTVTAGAILIDATVPPVGSPMHVTATPVDSTHMQVFTDQQSSYLTANLRPLRSIVVTTALAATVAAADFLQSSTFRINGAEASGPQGPFIAGKAFTYSSSTFLPVCMLENYARATLGANTDTQSTQCAFFVIDATGFSVSPTTSPRNVVAGALYRKLGLVDLTLGGAAPTVSTPCTVAGPIGSDFTICLQERGRLDLTRGINFTPVGLSSIKLTPRTTTGAVSTELGESTYLAGGQLGNYDGRQMMQHGFPMFPEGISAVNAVLGAGSLTPGVHQVVAVYEWTDGAGNRCQSAPSLPVSVTVVNATDQINVIVPTTQLAQQSGYSSGGVTGLGDIATLSIVTYMTTAGGLTFYRCPANQASPTLNTTAASTVAFNLGATNAWLDATLTGNEILYTQPNIATSTLPNIAPGPVSALAAAEDRLWYLKADQPLAYGFSQSVQTNTGLQFNEALGGLLPTESGGGVAVALLDEKPIIFGRDRIYAIHGTPPDSSGAGSRLSQPIDIQSEVGCSEARSVLAQGPDGIIFKAKSGWHLLGRDLTVRYIGDGVSAYDSQPVTSAVLMGDRKEARFTVSGASDDGFGPKTLVYSTLSGQWSIFMYGAVSASSKSVADAAWWEPFGAYVWSTTANGLNYDYATAVADTIGAASAVVIPWVARTAWLKLGALEGFQRVRRLYLTTTGGNSPPDSTFVLSVAFNDEYTLIPPGYSVSVSTSNVSTSVEAFDIRHKIANLQKCKSIAFTFRDTPTATDTACIAGIQALALEIGLKKGVRKLPAAQTVG